MRLMSVKYLRTSLGELDYDDVNTMLESALDLVTQPLEGLIQTEFEKKEVSDIFRIDNLSATLSRELTRLRLSKGLLDPDAPPVITYSDTLSGLSKEVEVETAFHFDYLNGKVVFDGLLNNGWLKVTYTGGMKASGDEYSEKEVPSWLRSAAVIYASSVFSRLVLEKNRDREKALKGDPGAITTVPPEVYNIISKYIRWYPDSYSPEYTV